MPYAVFHAPDPAPSASALRARVRHRIERCRLDERNMEVARGRPDIAALMRSGRGLWGEKRREVGYAFRFYQAVWRAELAHRRGEHLDRWAIWSDAA